MATDETHVRETTTPIGDELVADCSCGDTYSVPQGGDEYKSLEDAHARHVTLAEVSNGEG